jgi:hypothetical protein
MSKEKLPFKVAEKDSKVLYVASASKDNFDKLPKEVREKLLLKFANI